METEGLANVVVDGINYSYRPGYDYTILTKEWAPYAKRVTFNKSDIWLDLGGHIGLFTCHAAKLVHGVYTVEASPDNFDILYQNVQQNNLGNVTLVQAAVVGVLPEGGKVDFYLNVHDNTGLHSLVVKRGRDKVTVDAITFDELLRLSLANKVKMDIEGGELDIFKNLDEIIFRRQVQELIMEYHFQSLHDGDHNIYFGLLNQLVRMGFTVDAPADPKKAWTCIIHAKR